MGSTPNQIVEYIFKNNYEASFLSNMQMYKGGFSIGEIADRRFVIKDGRCHFRSKTYQINTEIFDDDIIAAANNGMYISAFLSRKAENYNVHFLVHQCKKEEKEQFEEEITMEVVRYMIMATVLALRLDTEKKVDDYLERGTYEFK